MVKIQGYDVTPEQFAAVEAAAERTLSESTSEMLTFRNGLCVRVCEGEIAAVAEGICDEDGPAEEGKHYIVSEMSPENEWAIFRVGGECYGGSKLGSFKTLKAAESYTDDYMKDEMASAHLGYQCNLHERSVVIFKWNKREMEAVMMKTYVCSHDMYNQWAIDDE